MTRSDTVTLCPLYNIPLPAVSKPSNIYILLCDLVQMAHTFHVKPGTISIITS